MACRLPTAWYPLYGSASHGRKGGGLVIAAIAGAAKNRRHGPANRSLRPLRRHAEPRRHRPAGGLRRGRAAHPGHLPHPYGLAGRRSRTHLQWPDRRTGRNPRAGRCPAHPPGPRRPGHPAPRCTPHRLAARARPPGRAPGLGVHRCHPARRGGAPGRAARHDALGVQRQARPRPPGRGGGPRPHLCARRAGVDVRRRHLGHRPRARPGRGGPGPGRRPHHRPPPGRLPAQARQPGPVQRPARRPDRATRAVARGSAVDHRAPGRRPERGDPRRPGPSLAPPLRPLLPDRDRHDAGPVRRPGPPRTRPPPPGGHLGRHRGDLPRQRLRHPRGDAPRLRQSPRHGPFRVPPPLPPDSGPLKGTPVQIAIVLYDRFTALDAVGPYETLGRLPDSEVVFVAEETGPVRTDSGNLALIADRTLAEVPNPDVVVVPGGPGQTPQMTNEALLDWIRVADTTSTWTTSVCTGSLLLAAAGRLEG